MNTKQNSEQILQEVRDNWDITEEEVEYITNCTVDETKNEEAPYILMLMDDVQEESMSELINQILCIDMDNQHEGLNTPIHLYVSTYGGSAYDCFALCDVISTIETPVYTFALGKVMSAGLPILSSGDYRYTFKNTSFLYHEVQSEFCGSIRDIEIHTKEVNNLMGVYDKILLDNTNLKQDDLDVFKNHNEIYFNAEDVLMMGIVDEIL